MKQLTIFISSIIISLILFQSMLAQGNPPLLSFNETNIIGGRTSTAINRLRSENEIYLETFFLPDTIPISGIPVLENALGDVVKDSMVNILDLLRLRDIIIGRPPSPSSYENSKSDLSHDEKIDAQDLKILRDILLRKVSVPYLVGSTGGQVLGDGITLTLPPGAVDSTIIISIKRNSESEFANDMGVDTKGAVEDSAYFMASFEITSSIPNFKLPVDATIKLDSVPPCAYQGLNGLFAAVPDRDGDGRTELFLINELNVNNDSLTLTAGDIAVPSIQSLSVSLIEPGQPLLINGHGFGNDQQNIVIHFQSKLSDTFRITLPTVCNDSTILCVVSDVPFGLFQLTIRNVLTGLISNAIPIEISSYSSVVSDIRGTIVNFYSNLAMSVDSINDNDLVNAIEDTTIRYYYYNLMQTQRASIDSGIMYFSNVADSLLEGWRSLAAFIQNINQSEFIGKEYRDAHLSQLTECQPCKPITKRINQFANDILVLTKRYNKQAADCAVVRFANPPYCEPCVEAERIRKMILRNTDIEALLANLYNDCACRNCGGSGCDKCDRTTFIGFGPEGKRISGGYKQNGFSTQGCCINIIRYKRNLCINIPQYYRGYGSPVPIDQPSGLSCPPTIKFKNVSAVNSELDTRAHTGSIIKVTNAQVPYNIVGILNDNGNAFIPQVPINTKITFSIFDPVTGLYDSDAGTYTTGLEPGGFDRPILLFQPNTQIRNYIIKIGEPVHDSVSLNSQRIDYLLNIGATDTSMLLNIGFSASARLSFRIEDPEGSVLFDNTDVTCYSNAHLKFYKTGMYRLRVAYGVSGQSGSFDLGVTYSPYHPLPSNCLCGNVLMDTLFEKLSPYTVKCSANILTNDSLITEPGVTLQFESGGILSAAGTLQGEGTPIKPIKLKHADQVIMNKTAAAGGIIKNPMNKRKEVQP